jgi:hypothetical protein
VLLSERLSDEGSIPSASTNSPKTRARSGLFS